MAKKKNVDTEPVPSPQDALMKDMDDLDYGVGAAPSSTTTPERPAVPVETAPEPAPDAEGAPPVTEAGEAIPAREEAPGEPTPIAGVEAGVVEGPVEAAAPPVKTPEEKLKELQGNQVAHYQKLYEDLKRELDEVKAKAPPAEPVAAVQAPKPPTPEEIRRHYEPEAERVVEQGYMSREFVDDYPNDVAQLLYHRDILYNAVKKVEELSQWASNTVGQQRNTAAESNLNSLLDKVSEKGFHFQPLKDPEVRKAFRGYLDQVNPMCNADNVEEVISQQYLAFNHQAVLAALSGGTAAPSPNSGSIAPAASVAPPLNLTMGEHSGTRTGGPGPGKKDPFLAEMDDLD
jgi:hypothetical protein